MLKRAMKTETTIEARKLSPEEQWFLRKTIVKLHTKGFSASAISKMLDAKSRHVQSTIKRYKEGGWEAISLKTMGRPKGTNSTLTPDQEEKIKNVLITKKPESYGLSGFLWDMRNVLALIVILFHLNVPRSSMSTYFSRWGFTPQRPVIRNYKQNPEHVRKWIEEEYPVIKSRAKAEKADIYWGDETGVQNECNYVRGYAPKGATPEAKLNSDRKLRINMMSAITNQGKLRFMLYEGKMNQQRMIDYMKRLVTSNDRKVFLILDNLSVHHGKILKAWVEENKSKIEVFYLPSYSPELNPDEFLNGTLKRELEKRGNAKDKKEFISNVRSSIMTIQRNHLLVRNLFLAKSINYAAEG
jgi:transposase